MDTTQLKSCSNKKSYEASFEYFSSMEKLTFFRILMGAGAVTCLVALLVFTIQIQDYKVVACMASFTGLNFLLIFIPLKFQIYLKYILGLVYMSYVASVAVIGLIGVNVPLFIHGYASGVMFSTMLQFCEYKLKGLLTLSTPWIFLILFGSFSISNIHFIIYTICTSVIQGYLNYLYDNKQKKIFSQKEIIKQQKNVIKEFTSDSLFAISYDERSRNFKLEFANQMFEKTYSDDFKDFLRNHIVLSLQEQLLEKIILQKHETIEEFLFEQNNKNSEQEHSKSFTVIVENKVTRNQHNLSISRAYFAKQIYFIAIKSNQTNIQIEKYEKVILKQKQSIINLSNEIGSRLQRLYQNLNVNFKTNTNIESFESLLSKIDIIEILIIIKNYLIFYQQEKFFSLNCSAEIYELKTVLIPLLQLIEMKCKQYQRVFTYPSLSQSILMRLDQKLLTQIFLNVFYSILKYSSDNSIIRLKVSPEVNLQVKQLKMTQKSQGSKCEFINSQEINNQILQFDFTFRTNQKIDNLDSVFCFKEKTANIERNLDEEITNFVNYLILKMIGPFNQISAKELHYPVPNQYLYQVIFHIYTDIQHLDPSFMKHVSQKS